MIGGAWVHLSNDRKDRTSADTVCTILKKIGRLRYKESIIFVGYTNQKLKTFVLYAYCSKRF